MKIMGLIQSYLLTVCHCCRSANWTIAFILYFELNNTWICRLHNTTKIRILTHLETEEFTSAVLCYSTLPSLFREMPTAFLSWGLERTSEMILHLWIIVSISPKESLSWVSKEDLIRESWHTLSKIMNDFLIAWAYCRIKTSGHI